MSQPDINARARPMRLAVKAGLSLLVLISLALAASNLDLEGYKFQLHALPLLAATGLFSFFPLFETGRLSALAKPKHLTGLRALGINGSAMVLVQAPFGLIGAEIYRANAYGRHGEPLPPVLAAVLIARALGLATTLLCLVITVGLLSDAATRAHWALSAAVALAGFVALLAGPAVLSLLPLPSLPTGLERFVLALRQVNLAQMMWATMWSVAIVIGRAFALYLSAQGLGASITPAFAIYASAAGLVVSLIPVVSGLVGVREGGIAGVLVVAGLPFAAGMLIAFVFRLCALAGALLVMGLAKLLKLKCQP